MTVESIHPERSTMLVNPYKGFRKNLSTAKKLVRDARRFFGMNEHRAGDIALADAAQIVPQVEDAKIARERAHIRMFLHYGLAKSRRDIAAVKEVSEDIAAVSGRRSLITLPFRSDTSHEANGKKQVRIRV